MNLTEEKKSEAILLLLQNKQNFLNLMKLFCLNNEKNRNNDKWQHH